MILCTSVTKVTMSASALRSSLSSASVVAAEGWAGGCGAGDGHGEEDLLAAFFDFLPFAFLDPSPGMMLSYYCTSRKTASGGGSSAAEVVWWIRYAMWP